ncbi:hypothetical protein GIB67_031201 [Kingdonia uniflora]|uniref:Uncharacterized protein n=1 Tax=Kingdonia uniflora TaxID=39325 RepID=A0A7J7NL15_9MAGN|nr:hypothetical protein GIB67_031201 [Kingdonia uniflora]
MMGSLPAKCLTGTFNFIAETFSFISSLDSDPLFSILVASYTLLLLYFPQIFINLIFSPILISTVILLSTLLRLGSIQKSEKQNLLALPNQYLEWVTSETDKECEIQREEPKYVALELEAHFYESFVEWNVGAPLEVIYEEHEGEEENDSTRMQMGIINRSVSLSLCYPESDLESSSSLEDFPDIMSFRWDEDAENEDSLIEIQLDHGKKSVLFQLEEENMIEIDISPFGGPDIIVNSGLAKDKNVFCEGKWDF